MLGTVLETRLVAELLTRVLILILELVDIGELIATTLGVPL